MVAIKPIRRYHEKNKRQIATLCHVAREANLSLTGVSMSLRGADGVSDETAERVGDIVRQMNYSPNATARSLGLNREQVSAVFCGGDILASGAMRAVPERGLRISEDIAVAGYDYIEFAAHLRVPLTIVSQPKYPMGVKGTEVLLKKILGGKEWYQIVLPSELVIRDSG
jgi:DNA-binding LacI/PurR family transcriptional regulator